MSCLTSKLLSFLSRNRRCCAFLYTESVCWEKDRWVSISAQVSEGLYLLHCLPIQPQRFKERLGGRCLPPPTTQLLGLGDVKLQRALFDPLHQGVDLLIVGSQRGVILDVGHQSHVICILKKGNVTVVVYYVVCVDGK